MDALTQNKPIATILTWLVLTVFCALIATGWWYLLAPPIGQRFVAGFIAVVLTVLAALCARQIGQLRADARLKGENPRWHDGWKPYLFLAIISALGTLNAAFVLFESRAILRHDIGTVRSAYNLLRDTAHTALPPRDHVAKVARVEALLGNLQTEISNPNRGNYCGVGKVALDIMGQIRTELPLFRPLNGSGPIRPCDDVRAEALYRAHAGIAREMLDREPGFLAANGPAKTAFLNTLDEHHARMDRSLAELETAASGIGTTDHLDMAALRSSRDDYNADRTSFFTLNRAPVTGIEEIRTLQSDQVNSYAATIELFWKRLFNVSTWFYLALAIAIDFIAIYLITALNVRFGQPRVDPDDPALAERRRFTTDPKFLWTDPVRA